MWKNVLSMEKDFLKITREDIEDIFSQITVSAEHFDRMNEYFLSKLESNEY